MTRSIRKTKKSISIDLPCSQASLKKARKRVEKFASSHGFEDEAKDIMLSVQEACKNAIQHGRPPDKDVHITCACDEDWIVVEVKNHGEGFDTSKLDRETPVLSPGGRGIRLMKGLMDKFWIKSDKEGTLVHMEKKRTGGGKQ